MNDRVDSILQEHAQRPGPLLLVLHAVQREFGYIPAECVPQIAARLNLSRAEVHGVISFYHYFRHTPRGEHVVQVCRAESCQAMQGERLAQHIERRLQVSFHQTTVDGRFTLEPVYCLGNCACSPAVMIDGELFGRVTPQGFDVLIDQYEAQK